MGLSTASLSFVPLRQDLADCYIAVGTRSYCQHYTHLWINSDPGPYLAISFTAETVSGELTEPDLAHFIIYEDAKPVGVMKLCKHRGFAHYPSRSALLLEKLYLLSEASNRGIGGQALLFAEAYARDLDKELVWLDTMQQGPALGFYLKNGYMLLGTRQLDLPGVLESERHMFVLGKKLSLT